MRYPSPSCFTHFQQRDLISSQNWWEQEERLCGVKNSEDEQPRIWTLSSAVPGSVSRDLHVNATSHILGLVLESLSFSTVHVAAVSSFWVTGARELFWSESLNDNKAWRVSETGRPLLQADAFARWC